ncbi:hypothetical protein, partial [Sphingomonas sp. STIS6.2]|uniref:hypothetical protein n=1 Tax=Sphingomonas sp. STIS6.2 TaxID=1379700 RepID=UPI001F37FCDF
FPCKKTGSRRPLRESNPCFSRGAVIRFTFNDACLNAPQNRRHVQQWITAQGHQRWYADEFAEAA